MTHGDKDKAKKAASKASGKSSKQAVEAGKGSQAGAKSSGKTVEARKTGGEKAPAPTKKGGAASQAQASAKADNGKGGKGSADAKTVPQAGAKPQTESGKGRPARPAAADSGTPGFNNPVVANAFKRAIKKYPNAFRRLTD